MLPMAKECSIRAAMKIRALYFLLPLAIACGSEKSGGSGSAPTTPAEEAPAAEEAAPVVGACGDTEQKPEVFGAKLTANDRELTPLTEIVKAPEAFTRKDLLMTGIVRANCQTRGCWMEIRPVDDRLGTPITVRFKDYEFFVPLNSRGATVKLDGRVEIKTLSAADVKHLEEEGASFSNKKPDGSVEQVEVTASGVEMCNRAKK